MTGTDVFDEKTKKLSFLKKQLQGLRNARYLNENDGTNIGILKNLNNLEKKIDEKDISNDAQIDEFQKIKHDLFESKQEKLFLSDYVNSVEKENKTIKEKYKREKQIRREKEQEKLFLKEEVLTEQKEKNIATKKYYKVLILSAIIVVSITSVYYVLFMELEGQKYLVNFDPQSTQYAIQNLNGDKIDTWVTWRLAEEEILHVSLLNSDKYDEKITDSIKSVLLSEEIILIDKSLVGTGPKGTNGFYFTGWAGALQYATHTQTLFNIPTKIKLVESSIGEGDVTILLSEIKNPNGFDAKTDLVVDETTHEILKARVTIFDVDNLTDSEIEVILRHEFGHVMGLPHSSYQNDLMAEKITTDYPYISECDVDAITLLYDGVESSQVVCEK
ncbi:MAG: hypothetical protein COA77_00320 [Thaumarchaeota archaeon]|nr:MAG: hypothetical protein COA77_00320 [Nitrososphaerota archaeon]